jgi:hypothetical protein
VIVSAIGALIEKHGGPPKREHDQRHTSAKAPNGVTVDRLRGASPNGA